MSKRDITIEDLTKIKGLSEVKGAKILEAWASGEETDLTAIPGVSERLAKEALKLKEDPDGYEPEPPTRRAAPVDGPEGKVAKKKATRIVATAGQAKAGDVRKFARDAEKLGLESLAEALRAKVASLLDDEKVETDSLR